jgi:HEAT repeat protein
MNIIPKGGIMRKAFLFVVLVVLVSMVFVSDGFAQADEEEKGEKEAEQALQDFRKVIESKETKPPEKAEEVLRDYGRARSRLLGLGKLATPVLVRAIKTKSFSEQFRGTCIDLLKLIQDERSVKPLIEVYEDESEISRIRKEALSALGKVGGSEVLPVLLEALESKKTIVRKGGISGIWGLAGRKVGEFPVDAIVDIAKNDPEISIRAFATASLRRGGKEAVSPLLELMNDENKYVRIQSCKSLGMIGDKRAVQPLIAKLDNSKETERMAAIIALGDIGDKRAVEPLIKILNIEDADSRTAAKALAKIGDKRAIEPLKIAMEKERRTFGSPSNHLLKAYKKLTGEEYEPENGGSE